MRKEQVKEFLKEYEALCNKYNFVVSACGCCDSPYIHDLEYSHRNSIKENISRYIKEDIKSNAEHLQDTANQFYKDD